MSGSLGFIEGLTERDRARLLGLLEKGRRGQSHLKGFNPMGGYESTLDALDASSWIDDALAEIALAIIQAQANNLPVIEGLRSQTPKMTVSEFETQWGNLRRNPEFQSRVMTALERIVLAAVRDEGE